MRETRFDAFSTAATGLQRPIECRLVCGSNTRYDQPKKDDRSRRWLLAAVVPSPDLVSIVRYCTLMHQRFAVADAPAVRSAKATCPCCHAVLTTERVRSQLRLQRGGSCVKFDAGGHRVGGAILLAVVSLRQDTQGRFYRLPTQHDYKAVWEAGQSLIRLPSDAIPNEPVNSVRPSPNARGLSAPTRYGVESFGDMFTDRPTSVSKGANRGTSR